MTALLGVWRIDEAGDPPRLLRPDEIVEDVENLVRGVIGNLGMTRTLSEADHEEVVASLFEQVVILTRSYDSDRDCGLVFRLWLYRQLRFRTIDVLRKWRGRRGEKGVVDERLVLTGTGREGLDDGDPALHHGESALTEDPGFRRAHRALPRGWTELRRDRRSPQSQRGLGRNESPRAA